ncbi:hypothetical protein LTR53_018231, partial [Teratosphaeriaceae sp. CCFEE 6253]
MAAQALAQSTIAATTVSLYLPFGGNNLAASIITAAPTATVYAIGCEIASGACAPGCSLDSSVTMTEGESTLHYTWTAGHRAVVAASGTLLVPDLTTVDCSLYGGTRATSAVCTGYSTVDGMGNMTAAPVTTTLAGSQVNYVAVTITAGPNGSATGVQPGPASGTSTPPAVATTNAAPATA